jgi:hypothetical protein
MLNKVQRLADRAAFSWQSSQESSVQCDFEDCSNETRSRAQMIV